MTIPTARARSSAPWCVARRRRIPIGAVLYVHGFTDYFFQTALADFFTERGFAFFALDLRKCGRSRRPGQTPHYVSEPQALRGRRAQPCPGRRPPRDRRRPGAAGRPLHRRTRAVAVAGPAERRPRWREGCGDQRPGAQQSLPRPAGQAVDAELGHPAVPGDGEDPAVRARSSCRPRTATAAACTSAPTAAWDYDLEWKPIGGFPITYGWINAIRRGHARLHKGLDVGVPSLLSPLDAQRTCTGVVARGRRARRRARHPPHRPMVRASATRSPRCRSGARHDVFLSNDEPRDDAYDALDRWLHDHHLVTLRRLPSPIRCARRRISPGGVRRSLHDPGRSSLCQPRRTSRALEPEGDTTDHRANDRNRTATGRRRCRR